MRMMKSLFGLWAALALGACVTINVYFPAAAAQKAADRIIEGVWGKDAAKPTPKSGAPGSRIETGVQPLAMLLEWVVPAAQAQQANIDISSPAIVRIQASMSARHRQLARFYDAGAIGLTADGRVAVRDARAVSLRDRAAVQQLVAADNRDRVALYAEIARANGHPEWEADIRATFARRWVARAKRGWWYESQGRWLRR